MQRQLVSAEELVRLINKRVRQLANTRGCAVAGVLRLNKPANDGCNWEEIGVKAIGTEGFREAMMEMRAAYNLEEYGAGEHRRGTAREDAGGNQVWL